MPVYWLRDDEGRLARPTWQEALGALVFFALVALMMLLS